MRGARSFAAIIVKLTEADLAVVRRDEAFDDIIVWLARWRADAAVNAAYQRLLGTMARSPLSCTGSWRPYWPGVRPKGTKTGPWRRQFKSLWLRGHAATFTELSSAPNHQRPYSAGMS